MSSFIEWPTVFGSTYVVPAIIVAVLLLVLILVMASRRRARGGRTRRGPQPLPPSDPRGYTPAVPAYQMPAPVPAYQMPAAARGGQMAGGMMQPLAPPPPAVGLVPMAPAAMPQQSFIDEVRPEFRTDFEPSRRRRRSKADRSAAGASPAVAMANDPISATIDEILDGWGDLTPDEKGRLELFRPDQLNAVLAMVQLPKSKSNDARVRLSQIRQYAADLERRDHMERVAAAASAAELPSAGTPEPVPAPAVALVPPPVVAPAPLCPTPVSPAHRSFYDSEAEPSTQPPVPAATPAASLEVAAATPAVPADAAPLATLATPTCVAPVAEMAAATELAAPAMVDETPTMVAAPRPAWEPDPEPMFQELPALAYTEVEIRPLDDVGVFDFATETGEEQVGDDKERTGSSMGVPLDTSALSAALDAARGGSPDAPVHTPPVPVTPAAADPLHGDDLFWDDEPPALSRMSVKVDTAEQLLALPPQERADMTAFLSPPELSATFQATPDPDLKKAVIDTLERIGTPASLDALGNCFEDGDPEVQRYALAAADRLLGVA